MFSVGEYGFVIVAPGNWIPVMTNACFDDRWTFCNIP